MLRLGGDNQHLMDRSGVKLRPGGYLRRVLHGGVPELCSEPAEGEGPDPTRGTPSTSSYLSCGRLV